MIDKTIKIELHAHTAEVSDCGRLSAKELIRLFARAGYAAVVITDHLYTNWRAELPMNKRVDAYLKGYRAAKAEGEKRGVHVLLGVEARIKPLGDEDFLVYGLSEDQLTPLIMAIDQATTLRQFTDAAHALGTIVVQAHPFRPKLRPMPYKEGGLDGIEGYNGNPRQENRNELALEHALRCGGLITSGSDAHQKPDIAQGGILAPEWVRDNASLLTYFAECKHPKRIEDGIVP